MRMRPLAILALLIAVGGACGSSAEDPEPTATDETPTADAFAGAPAAVYLSSGGDSGEAADISGEIIDLGGCRGVLDPIFGELVLVLPHDLTTWDQATGEIGFADSRNGTVTLEIGTKVVVGGSADDLGTVPNVEWLNLPCDIGPNIVVSGLTPQP